MSSPAGAYPRALSLREAEILDFMLSVDDPRIEPLRLQRHSAVVTGMCKCGCASIDLAVDRESSPKAEICRQPVAADLTQAEADRIGPSEYYGLLVFLDDGWLSLLEISWIEEPPPEFPPAAAFDPPRVVCRA
jgi:hypothetical protein